MKNILKYLFGIGVIVWLLSSFVGSSLIELILLFVIFVIFLGGSIYTVMYALEKTTKYRGKIDKEEIN